MMEEFILDTVKFRNKTFKEYISEYTSVKYILQKLTRTRKLIFCSGSRNAILVWEVITQAKMYRRVLSKGSRGKQIYFLYVNKSGPGSEVGIATGYGLDGPGIETWWAVRFSAPVQTCPGAHPALCTMGTGFFLGVKSGRSVTLTPYSLLVPWSRKSRAIPLLTL